MDYLTPTQIAEKWGVSRRSVRQYLENDRIPGVMRVNNRILIPADAKKPVDLRYAKKQKSGGRNACSQSVCSDDRQL